MLLTVHVRPNARETKIVNWLDEDTVKIDVAAPPKEGKANEELIDFLAEHFAIAKSRVVIVRGLTAKMKQVQIEK